MGNGSKIEAVVEFPAQWPAAGHKCVVGAGQPGVKEG